MNIQNIVIIGVIIAVLGAIVAYFTRHKKAGGIVIALGIASAGLAGYQSMKDQKLTDLATSEYEAVMFYQALYEATGNEQYKEIAQDEMSHLKILNGYGYQALEFVAIRELSIQGAIQSEQEAVKMYEEALSYVVADAALEADLNRILQDEKEHLDELIKMSVEPEPENESILNRIIQDLISKVRDLVSGVIA